ncbi:sulfotransferase domain-containing protein [Marinicella gelatinilytica]|uniref:sulfotransferase domain-containing protein n=1 Tax=Marinicella gelatinilytica TaxID=2996017 RepID=UPI0022609DED|nr:sulfotransferase domain-containing protein [Marinicella gelatinilytica]MCX7545265.1 sulfotransferase [Marinicella gelatinilytica]
MSNSILVSAFIGGVQKSGTRSISNYFRHHKNISVHCKKEGHFFDVDKNFTNNIPLSSAIDRYHSDFEINSSTKILCDISPDYIFRQNAVKRVHKYNPNANWVILLRNPIQRAYSAWNMEVNRKTESLSFEEALNAELAGNSKSRSHDRFQYINRSRYYPQLLNLWKYFPSSQCHIFSAELIWKNPGKALIQILTSMNIKPLDINNYEHSHKGSYSSSLSKDAHDTLVNNLHFELYELPTLLKWKENPWVQDI